MSILVVGVREATYIVNRELFEQIVKDAKEDWDRVSGWVTRCGVAIPQEDSDSYGQTVKLK